MKQMTDEFGRLDGTRCKSELKSASCYILYFSLVPTMPSSLLSLPGTWEFANLLRILAIIFKAMLENVVENVVEGSCKFLQDGLVIFLLRSYKISGIFESGVELDQDSSMIYEHWTHELIWSFLVLELARVFLLLCVIRSLVFDNTCRSIEFFDYAFQLFNMALQDNFKVDILNLQFN